MRHLLCAFIVIIVAFTACDQGREMVAPVVQEIVEDDTPVISIAEDTIVYSQYDVNQDGMVDNTDLTLVSAAIGQRQPANPRLDVDGSGTVDGADIILVSNNFGELASDTAEVPGIIEPIEPTESTTKPEIPEITFENALNLMPGQYRLKPIGYSRSVGGDTNSVIVDFYWGSVNLFGESVERDDIPLDAPKIHVAIILDPKPYVFSIDGEPVFDYDLFTFEIYDEIVVEIVSRVGEEEKRGGERGNRFPYKQVTYKGIAIENLTHPDRKFEYDE